MAPLVTVVHVVCIL